MKQNALSQAIDRGPAVLKPAISSAGRSLVCFLGKIPVLKFAGSVPAVCLVPILLALVVPVSDGSPSVEVDAAWPNWSVVSVAHRGGIVAGYPENTLAAFRRAIETGADVIEIDLRGTKDGEVVILHDATLDRTTTGGGPVTDHTLAELKLLDAGGGERIPTYEEVLGLVSGTGVKLLLDIKVSPVLDKEKVVRLTEKYGLTLDVIVGARTLEDLNEFRRLNPNLRTLGFVKSIEKIDAFAEAGVDIIRLWDRWIEADPELVGMVHRMGRPVWVTAKDASRQSLERLIKYGVNGILSDYPEEMALLLDEMKTGQELGE